MKTPRSLALLWFASLLAVAACGIRAWQTHVENGRLERQLAAKQTALSRTKSALAAAQVVADRLEARASRPADPISLTSEEMIIERLRSRLAESLSRHAEEKLPPPILDPFTAAAGSIVRMPLAQEDQAGRYRQLYRVRMEQNFNDIIQVLPVSSEVRTALLDLLVDRMLARLDLLAVSGANRWSPANVPTADQRAQVDAASVRQSEKFDFELQSLLGQAYPQFQVYEQTRLARSEISQLADRLSYTDHPLRSGQVDSLVALVEPHEAKRPFGDIDDAFESRAAPILDPAQQQALHALRVEQALLAQAVK